MARNPAKFDFCGFLTFSVRFGSFLASWRPGTRLKSFLEPIRFNSTVYEPVATLKTSNRVIFYVFLTAISSDRLLNSNPFCWKTIFWRRKWPPSTHPTRSASKFCTKWRACQLPIIFLRPVRDKTLFLFQNVLSQFCYDFSALVAPPTHYHAMSWALRWQPCVLIFLSGLPCGAGFFLRNFGLALCSGRILV